jgi:glucokinase
MIGAIDIGGTKIATGLVDSEGRLIETGRSETGAQSRAEAVLADAVQQLLSGCRTHGVTLEGIGIACTGPVDPTTGVVGNVDLLPGWCGVDLTRRFRETFGVRVAVENDADAAALGEFRWGAGVGAKRFVYVTISTGIGAGVILDGHLYRGVDGSHPEIGHQSIDASGPRCYCGACGCWESLVSGPALAGWFAVQLPAGDSAAGLDAASVCRLAAEGHPVARGAVERAGRYLGVGLSNLVTVLCPDVIALGGGLMRSAALFLDPARAVVARSCGLVPWRRTEIRLAGLGADSALIGAAQAWHHRFGDRLRSRA